MSLHIRREEDRSHRDRFSSRVCFMSPRSFEEAQELADCFKVQQLVIVNLQNVDRELSKRIVDFCAGLTYGLDGAVWPIGNRIFLLAPSSVEVLEEKDKQAAKRMFFNQL